jgi:hypothetical protein
MRTIGLGTPVRSAAAAASSAPSAMRRRSSAMTPAAFRRVPRDERSSSGQPNAWLAHADVRRGRADRDAPVDVVEQLQVAHAQSADALMQGCRVGIPAWGRCGGLRGCHIDSE